MGGAALADRAINRVLGIGRPHHYHDIAYAWFRLGILDPVHSLVGAISSQRRPGSSEFAQEQSGL